MSWNDAHESRYGVHSIDHFALEVPSLAVADEFFGRFGLNVERSDAGLALRTFGSDHVWSRIVEGPTKRLAWLTLNCWPDEFEHLAAQVLAAGGRKASPAPSASPGGLWFHDLDGNLLQLQAGPKTTPSALGLANAAQRHAGRRGVLGRGEATGVRPQRLSHVMLFSPDVARSVDFYRTALGLRLSDQTPGVVAFLHARHGSDHHLVAFVASSARGWHHSSWDVANIDEVGAGAEQMRRGGHVKGWGLGRHVLGSNYFHYVLDPWGSFAEYSAEIDFVPTGARWEGGDHPGEDSLYLWGPDVPDYFVRNSEA